MKVYLVEEGQYDSDLIGITKTFQRARQLVDEDITEEKNHDINIIVEKEYINEYGNYIIEVIRSYKLQEDNSSEEEIDEWEDSYFITEKEVLE